MFLKLISKNYSNLFSNVQNVVFTESKVYDTTSPHDYVVYGTQKFINDNIPNEWDIDDLNFDNFIFDCQFKGNYLNKLFLTVDEIMEAGSEELVNKSDLMHQDIEGTFIMFKSNDKKYLIFTNNFAYLYNNEGKTIEKI